MFGDLVIPFQLAFVDQHRQRRGGKHLGIGRYLEDRLAVDRRCLPEFAYAEAARGNDLAILDHGNGNAGHLEKLEDAVDVRVQVVGTGAGRGGCRHHRRARLRLYASDGKGQRKGGGESGHGLNIHFVGPCLPAIFLLTLFCVIGW